MRKPIILVNFNELIEPNLVLLSKEDKTVDLYGKAVNLVEGMHVIAHEEYPTDKEDVLTADGVVELNKDSGWSSHVKWCCRIDNKGINTHPGRL